MSNIVPIDNGALPQRASDYDSKSQFLTVSINNQIFGIPVLKVRDALKPVPITNIPLSKPEILGYMNLRGRIVTVIDVRKRLNQPAIENGEKQMFIVVEYKDELYSLLVDKVGDAKTIPYKGFEKVPSNLSPNWAQVSRGVFKLDEGLMLVLDIDSLLEI